MKTFKEFLLETSYKTKVPKSFNKKKHLYHASHTSNLKDIQSMGLIPQVGEIVSGTEVWSEYSNDLDDKVTDVLFFSEDPDYLEWQIRNKIKKPKITLDDLKEHGLLAIVRKRDSIYHNIESGEITDYKGKHVDTVEYGNYNYAHFTELPPYIERDDWFSLEDQDPDYLLFSEELINFLQNYFPKSLKRFK